MITLPTDKLTLSDSPVQSVITVFVPMLQAVHKRDFIFFLTASAKMELTDVLLKTAAPDTCHKEYSTHPGTAGGEEGFFFCRNQKSER